jgi:hypothetical protein
LGDEPKILSYSDGDIPIEEILESSRTALSIDFVMSDVDGN